MTLWEILTFAREQPHESLSDEAVIANLSSLYHHGSSSSKKNSSPSFKQLGRPRGCPREVADLMEECWRREETARPAFREIHLFLQRKNLGYRPEIERQEARKGATKEEGGRVAVTATTVDRLV